MKKRGMTPEQALDLLEPYYKNDDRAQEWPVSQCCYPGFLKGKDGPVSSLPRDTWSILVTTSMHSITIPIILYKLENGKIAEMATLINSGATICCIDLHLI